LWTGRYRSASLHLWCLCAALLEELWSGTEAAKSNTHVGLRASGSRQRIPALQLREAKQRLCDGGREHTTTKAKHPQDESLTSQASSCRRHRTAITARQYLDHHNLLSWVQLLFQDLERDRPLDPWSYIQGKVPGVNPKVREFESARDTLEPSFNFLNITKSMHELTKKLDFQLDSLKIHIATEFADPPLLLEHTRPLSEDLGFRIKMLLKDMTGLKESLDHRLCELGQENPHHNTKVQNLDALARKELQAIYRGELSRRKLGVERVTPHGLQHKMDIFNPGKQWYSNLCAKLIRIQLSEQSGLVSHEPCNPYDTDSSGTPYPSTAPSLNHVPCDAPVSETHLGIGLIKADHRVEGNISLDSESPMITGTRDASSCSSPPSDEEQPSISKLCQQALDTLKAASIDGRLPSAWETALQVRKAASDRPNLFLFNSPKESCHPDMTASTTDAEVSRVGASTPNTPPSSVDMQREVRQVRSVT